MKLLLLITLFLSACSYTKTTIIPLKYICKDGIMQAPINGGWIAKMENGEVVGCEDE